MFSTLYSSLLRVANILSVFVCFCILSAFGLHFSAGIWVNRTQRKFRFDYFLKDIALLTRDIYKGKIMDKIDNSIKQIRCENYFFEHGKRKKKS